MRALIASYSASLVALRQRGVIRSSKVLGDYAEWLAAGGLGLELVEDGAQRGYDAVEPETGLRYQVKARQVVPPYMQPDLRGHGSLDDRPFDLLVGVLIGAQFEVIRAAVVPIEVVRARVKRIAATGGYAYRLHFARGLLSLPEVRDVTGELRRVADS